MAKGKVYMIGAGIGSSDMITIKGKRTLDKADVIIYDRLINYDLVREYEGVKELIYVGKKAYSEYIQQEDINDIILREARMGKVIARLKGGDPYVFGRGGEEAEILVENGIDFEVIPGVTSGVVALAYAGMPATHRGLSTSVSFITGHRKEGMDFDFTPYAKLDGTLVFYMGLKNLHSIADGLVSGGMDSSTPAAVIMNGGYPTQKVFTSTIGNIAEEILNKGFQSPSLIVVGNVVGLRDTLNFFETRPLFGKNIVVTRARSQASLLVDRLSDLGANVIEAPTIELKAINGDELNSVIRDFDYTHLLFNSVNGVDIFMKAFLDVRDIRDLFNVKLGVVGKMTRKALEAYGLRAEIMPEKYVGEDFTDEVIKTLASDSKVLLLHSAKSRQSIIDKLKSAVETVAVPIYDTVNPNELTEIPDEVDYVLFTSSSTVDNFVDSYGVEAIGDGKVISIGPITTETIERRGLILYRESEYATIDSMVKLIEEDVYELANEKA